MTAAKKNNDVSLSKSSSTEYTVKKFKETEMNKKLSILHYFAAVGFFIVFVIRILKGSFSSSIIWFFLGAVNFSLGTFYLIRNKKNNNNKEGEK